jgi:hypothetical protein
MKLKDGFILNKVGGAYLAVAVGERADEFRALVKLNATGAFLWEQLAAGERGACELADALVGEYGITAEQALADAEKFEAALRSGGLLDE